MTERLPVAKTYKLFIGGAFPRSESGRSLPIVDASGRTLAHGCKASRKDLRDAVVAARKAQPGWAGATAYLRGQILYRMAEMMEGKRAEFVQLMGEQGTAAIDANREVSAAIDRLVRFAGWTDKFAQVLGCQNPVAAPYWNITTPEPVGCVGVVCAASLGGSSAGWPSLLPLIALIAPAICAGNAVVAVVASPPVHPGVAAALGEVLATSDLPGGVVNLLTGDIDELLPFLSQHRDVDAIVAADGAALGDDRCKALRLGAADNLKRVTIHREVAWLDAEAGGGPSWLEPALEFKTVWHPVGA